MYLCSTGILLVPGSSQWKLLQPAGYSVVQAGRVGLGCADTGSNVAHTHPRVAAVGSAGRPSLAAVPLAPCSPALRTTAAACPKAMCGDRVGCTRWHLCTWVQRDQPHAPCPRLLLAPGLDGAKGHTPGWVETCHEPDPAHKQYFAHPALTPLLLHPCEQELL